MGIPKYHKWLTERYPTAFAEAHQERADHVYVDVNALLHDCMRHAASEEQFFQELFKKFDSLFWTVSPDKSVFLAVDGPASCAKCLTQRQRRRAHASKDAKNAKNAKGKKGKGKGQGNLSNNMLTPGVPFMTKLTSGLEYYAASRMKANGPFAKCHSVTVSGAHAIGEGEHKIVSQMLRHAGSLVETGADAESHVIVSGDADVFLLSLVQSACRRVRVVSERPYDPSRHGKRRKGMVLEIWNAEVLGNCIERELTSESPQSACATAEEISLRRDFAFISLLAGNDYLPELKCSLTPQRLWEQYLLLRRGRFPESSILRATPTAEETPLSHSEEGWALTVGESGAAFVAEQYEHFSFDEELLGAVMQAASAGMSTPGELSERQTEGVQKYLEGLLWILEMYHHGYCADFYFVLEKCFHSCAHAAQIVTFLSTAVEPIAPPRSGQPPMRPLSCALCILPVSNAETFLCAAVPALRPMLASDHPLLGPVNAIERNDELQQLKARSAQLQQEMMSLRSLGRDDTKVKKMLTETQVAMERIKKGGSDVDVVPLREVDAEVVERCSEWCDRNKLTVLSFAEDVSLVRSEDAEAFTLQPPVRHLGPAQCTGISYLTGEWPRASGQASDGMQTSGCDDIPEEEAAEVAEAEEEEICEEVEEGDEETGVAEEDIVEAGDDDDGLITLELFPGTAVEGYWPDDDAWLPATVDALHLDGSLRINWEDLSQSEVPADYVRLPEQAVELTSKRRRTAVF